MIIKIGICLYILLIQQVFIIHADETCYYRNLTTLVSINCDYVCCSGMATTPETACCNNTFWTVLIILGFIISGICFIAIFLIYFRSLLKICLSGCKYSYGSQSSVSSPESITANNNPVHIIHNDDLPDYRTIVKDSQMKDITPPPYNFVTAHPTDFGLEARVPSAPPPQYHSRCNSATTVVPIGTIKL